MEERRLFVRDIESANETNIQFITEFKPISMDKSHGAFTMAFFFGAKSIKMRLKCVCMHAKQSK